MRPESLTNTTDYELSLGLRDSYMITRGLGTPQTQQMVLEWFRDHSNTYWIGPIASFTWVSKALSGEFGPNDDDFPIAWDTFLAYAEFHNPQGIWTLQEGESGEVYRVLKLTPEEQAWANVYLKEVGYERLQED